MSITIFPPRRSSHAHNLHNGRRLRANFARQMTITEFGWHFARALDQADFIDRQPGQFPAPAPEARSR